MGDGQRVLLKLRGGAGADPAAAASGATLRPLVERSATAPGSVTPALGIDARAPDAWYVAELPDGGATPWDAAHARVAVQLGLAATDVVAVEPDLCFERPTHPKERAPGDAALGAAPRCLVDPPTSRGGRVLGPARFAWHLEDAYTGLASARDAVSRLAPRPWNVTIAHLDTGYDREHVARPGNLLTGLERNFIDADGRPNDARDPNRRWLLDSSGHGTGTLGILAGNGVAELGGAPLGGAAPARVLPLRVASSVVHLWTSAFAEALRYAVANGCDVVSASLGGLPSRAWNDAVNEAYEAGVLVVAASGDCLAPSGLPTHHVVYPARYHRAIAACGAMANGQPYYHLASGIQGSWGPESSMRQALSAYTPNIPWAEIGCKTTIDLDGEGTSAATPQIAAAAAIWIERWNGALPRDWRRVEAVKRALFSSARRPAPGLEKYLGHGLLDALAALAVEPRLDLAKTPPDRDFFAFLRVMTGLGIDGDRPSPRQAMFELELQQRWLANAVLQALVPDPEASPEIPRATLRRFVDAAIADEGASLPLRRHLAERYALVFGGAKPPAPPSVVPPPRPAFEAPTFAPGQTGVAILEAPPNPTARRIRVYAVDPSYSTRFETAASNVAVLPVRWETLAPGPVGDCVEVVDEDASGVRWPPVDLDDPRLLAQDGFAPAEGDPRFHQQMVYAVAMTTIAQFERALGRPVLWRPRPNPADEFDDKGYVRRLTIRPHAFRQANAYYSPREVALLFGHFEAGADDPGERMPGSAVYTCLSHDIVAHETTHAILDGMHRRFHEPTNDDVLAFHEAFADLVALMQHFALPGILEREIRKTRGDLSAESMLGQLAVEFGGAIGNRGALRSAIGKRDEQGVWQRLPADPNDYQRLREPHARGALLVAAVFDAFLAIYNARAADLLRLATGGTGVLPAGAIHPDLVRRLSAEAGKSARHVLDLSIRALDYLPPVDVTFGEYLRAIITADFDLVPDDDYGYRVAFVEAFRRRGLYPRGLKTLSIDTLRWRGVTVDRKTKGYKEIVKALKAYATNCIYLEDREKLFHYTRNERARLHDRLAAVFAGDRDLALRLGVDPSLGFEVHGLRTAARVGANGHPLPQVIVELTQARAIEVPGAPGPIQFRGGATLVIDLGEGTVAYAIVKEVGSETREARTCEFLANGLADPVGALRMRPTLDEPLARLHGSRPVQMRSEDE